MGPLYRRVQRKVEQGEAIEGLSVGVRPVPDLLHKHGPMTVPQMGRAQAISRQFVQRMVNDAAARGLVESIPNPAHQRSSLIRLTPGGDLTDADVRTCVRVPGEMLKLFDHVDVN
nr:MarR family transcriptional regulator [Streptomyces sp. TRM70350]